MKEEKNLQTPCGLVAGRFSVFSRTGTYSFVTVAYKHALCILPGVE